MTDEARRSGTLLDALRVHYSRRWARSGSTSTSATRSTHRTSASTRPDAAPDGGGTSSRRPRSAPSSVPSWPGRSTPGGTSSAGRTPYIVVEAGAGPGTLARSVLAAAPRCAEALRLELVDPRRRSGRPTRRASCRDHAPRTRRGRDGPVVVLANELLDNLPFGLVGKVGPRRGRRCGSGGIRDVVAGRGLVRWTARVPRGARGGPGGTRRSAPGCRSRPTPPPGSSTHSRWPPEWDAWSRSTTPPTRAALARRPWDEWVRTYAGRVAGGSARGARTATSRGRSPSTSWRPSAPDPDRDQATFLRAHGLDALVAAGRALARRGHTGRSVPSPGGAESTRPTP